MLILWLTGSDGPRAIGRGPIRRHFMPPLIPFAQVILWLLLVILGNQVLDKLLPDTPDAMIDFYGLVWIAAAEIFLTVLFLAIVPIVFIRGFRGFGLGFKNITDDLLKAPLYYLATFPLVFAGLWLIQLIGMLLQGPDFAIQSHEGLALLIETGGWTERIILILCFVLVAPVFEEVLFRGFVQSTVRGYINAPWPAVLITSGLFAALHPPMHWIALFSLSVCLGYAYERTGSLWRAILIHVIFNAVNVLAALFVIAPAG